MASRYQDIHTRLASLGIEDHISQFPGSYPDLNPKDLYRSYIAQTLAPISLIDKNLIYSALQFTSSAEQGDLTLAVPRLRVNPKEANAKAAQWAESFPPNLLVDKPAVDNQTLRFFFNPTVLAKQVIPLVLEGRQNFGRNPNFGLRDPSKPSAGRKKIVVEFSSPNIAKPFHAGHLRSTIIGAFFSNLYESAGWDVERINYLGDWGRQFGLLAEAYGKWGSEELLKTDPINHLFNLYVQVSQEANAEEKVINDLKGNDLKRLELQVSQTAEGSKERESLQVEQAALIGQINDLTTKSWYDRARRSFKLLEEGDPSIRGLWARFRELSIKKYEKTYDRLNIQYSDYCGESKVGRERMDKAIAELESKGVAEKDDGALMINFKKSGRDKIEKKLGIVILQKTDGASTYFTRDVGEIERRYEKYNFDLMFYVVSSQQDLHLKQVFVATSLAGRDDIASKSEHINYGLVAGMSTRKGTVKFLDDILNEAKDRMHEVMRANQDKYKQVEDPEKTADTLGISGVMIQDMSGKRVNGYTYDQERMLSFEGDTGPYLQYAHARLCSMRRKANISDEELKRADLNLLAEEHATKLIRALARYPDVFQNTYEKTREPASIVTYLFQMTHLLSSSYDVLKVVGSEPGLAASRMALYESARQVLNNGLKLLGLTPLER